MVKNEKRIKLWNCKVVLYCRWVQELWQNQYKHLFLKWKSSLLRGKGVGNKKADCFGVWWKTDGFTTNKKLLNYSQVWMIILLNNA